MSWRRLIIVAVLLLWAQPLTAQTLSPQAPAAPSEIPIGGDPSADPSVQSLEAENAALRTQIGELAAEQELMRLQLEELQSQFAGAAALPTPSPQIEGSQSDIESLEPALSAESEYWCPPEEAKGLGTRYDNIEHYQDGIVIWQTPEDARVPLLMRFNVNTQVRYLNTTSFRRHFHRPSGRCPRGPKAK